MNYKMSNTNRILMKTMGTENQTSPSITPELYDNRFISYILISVFVLVFLIGTTGNILVLYLFKFRNKNRLSTMESLICYLALADLLASIINPAMFIYWTVTGHRVWHFGTVGCVILPSLTRITVSYSFGMISVITIDRYRVICRPSKWQIKPHLTWVPALFVFVLSILSDIPKMVYVNVKHGHGCDVNDHQTSGHYIYPRVAILFVRNILFVFLFSITLYFINKELFWKEKITTLREQMNLKRIKKIVWLLISMAVIFIILVFPRDIFLIAFETSHLFPPGIRTTQTIQHINSTLKVLHMCNCLCNPFIYAKLHYQFKRDLRSMISCSTKTKGVDFNEEKTSLSSGHYVIIRETSKYSRGGVRTPIKDELNRATRHKSENDEVRPKFALTRYKGRQGNILDSMHKNGV